MTTTQEASGNYSIAVLDQNGDAAEVAAHLLRALGFEATPFTSIQALQGTIDTRPFDAYVLPWLVRSINVSELLAAIRSADACCPVVILTGLLLGVARTGEGSQLASAIETYKLRLCEKPMSMKIIAALLRRDLERPTAVAL